MKVEFGIAYNENLRTIDFVVKYYLSLTSSQDQWNIKRSSKVGVWSLKISEYLLIILALIELRMR